MSKKQFRWLCLLFIGIVACNLLLAEWKGSIPYEVIDGGGRLQACLPKCTFWFFFFMGMICIVNSIVGLIALLFFKRWGRYCLLVATMIGIVSTPLFAWSVYTGWQQAASEVEIMLQGILLYVCFSKAGQELWS